MDALAMQCKKIEDSKLCLDLKLDLVKLIVAGIKSNDPNAPMSELYGGLRRLVEETAFGCRIDHLKPEDSNNGFRTCQISSEDGIDLGSLHMIYMRKPFPCYYLVYVEVKSFFRQKGLGNKVIDYYVDFLNRKKSVGILDNIIPEDNPAYGIYAKNKFISIRKIISEDKSAQNRNFMIYIPFGVRLGSIRKKISQTLYHIDRKEELIAIRDNEAAVKKTIAEFKSLKKAIEDYFSNQPLDSEERVIMRFMYTRFITKLIAFKRNLKSLFGYTGGESMEQIVIPPEALKLKIRSYLPNGYSGKARIIFCADDFDPDYLSEEIKIRPAESISKLPNYRRPIFLSWAKQNNLKPDFDLTVKDLLDLGFDPTRLKEINANHTDYIFERIQAWQVEEIMNRQKRLQSALAKIKMVGETFIEINPIVLIIEDCGNAYLLRQKVNG
ncbi:MAG: MBL fold metallo-hydrolase, partial [Patescibacteria group bacterium]|nr:MBL fold metallo-hydrolase [Patescibacteria group bacterium]